MQVILDSSFARPGSAPIWGGKKGEFRDWIKWSVKCYFDQVPIACMLLTKAFFFSRLY